MHKTQDIINKLKADPGYVDKLLYPGRQLSDYDVDQLKVTVLPSGFNGLDKMMLLKQGRGELVFVGARPSQGKSALLVQIATTIAETGRVHFTTLEDNHESIATRQTARLLNRGIDTIQRGLVSREDLLAAQTQIGKLDLVIEDRGGLNVYQICDAIRMNNQKKPLTAAFIDYIQIIASERKVTRAEDLATISGALKALAKELKIPIIIGSQLNRQSELTNQKGEKRAPQLSDLRDSGALEQDADATVLIHRQGELTELLIVKNKNGPTGSVHVKFASAQCRFWEGGGELE